jgi:hypothetical protein
VVFVNVSSSAPSKGRSSPSAVIPPLAPRLCSKVPEANLSLFIKHFFSVFLVRNNFGGALDVGSIISQFQNSPSLYHASIAVGALDLSRNLLLSLATDRKDTALGALTAYRTSITTFQSDIMRKDAQIKEVNLWTTFFLGLFEVSP